MTEAADLRTLAGALTDLMRWRTGEAAGALASSRLA
jgi:hypothetical protein